MERRYRQWRESLEYLVKDLLAFLTAFVVIIGTAITCFAILFQEDATHDERHWAMSVLASMMTALVGFAVGRATKGRGRPAADP